MLNDLWGVFLENAKDALVAMMPMLSMITVMQTMIFITLICAIQNGALSMTGDYQDQSRLHVKRHSQWKNCGSLKYRSEWINNFSIYMMNNDNIWYYQAFRKMFRMNISHNCNDAAVTEWSSNQHLGSTIRNFIVVYVWFHLTFLCVGVQFKEPILKRSEDSTLRSAL
jgi:hypothetical protein